MLDQMEITMCSKYYLLNTRGACFVKTYSDRPQRRGNLCRNILKIMWRYAIGNYHHCWAPAQPEHDPTRMGESLPKPEFMLFVLVVHNNNRSIVINPMMIISEYGILFSHFKLSNDCFSSRFAPSFSTYVVGDGALYKYSL